ncbi:MAG: MBOAT family protein, partial [Oscillospiraceae bacterium]|nr:MBOAT family protein [Oscillospiraceae bacterium]
LCRLMYGLGKKVIIADSVGKIAEQCLTFGDAPVSVLAAWAGVIMYSLQIYFDFSGYSDMAIGMGLMCGFTFPENFDHPYASKSVTEFWRRWHISLGTFFRDYVYIPLGGNRRHQMINILVVWALTGLWHGASGNFVLWGLYFALFLVLEKKYLLSFFKSVPAVFGHIYTLIVAVFGWAIFYFTDLGKLLTCLKSMFGAGGLPMTDMVTESTLKGNIFIIAAALLLCAPVYPKLKQLVDKLCGNTITFTVYGLCKIVFLMGIFLLSAVSLVGDTYSPFLYFRF